MLVPTVSRIRKQQPNKNYRDIARCFAPPTKINFTCITLIRITTVYQNKFTHKLNYMYIHVRARFTKISNRDDTEDVRRKNASCATSTQQTCCTAKSYSPATKLPRYIAVVTRRALLIEAHSSDSAEQPQRRYSSRSSAHTSSTLASEEKSSWLE